MSNTTTTAPTITYSRDEKIARLQQMIDEKRHVCLTINHRKSYGYIYGYLERTKDEMFKISGNEGLSYTIFPFEDVDAVGSTCIWLRY